MDEFQNIPPEKLHYIYGANCFQHAIGYPASVLSVLDCEDGFSAINYFKLIPGNYSISDSKHIARDNQYQNAILEGCATEGLIPCGDRLVLREGYRTLALYFMEIHGRTLDFHFAFLNSKGMWESKFIFEKPKEYPTVASAGRHYGFHCYLLAPDNLVPSCIGQWNAQRITLSPDNQPLDIIDPKYAWQYECTTVSAGNQGSFAVPRFKMLFPRASWPLPRTPTFG